MENFQPPQFASSIHHDPPPIHHNLTSEKPHPKHPFSKTPFKNARKNTKKAPATAGTFFYQTSKKTKR
jgi:hypothetical protein